MNGKAREMYNKYITEKLNQVFSDIDAEEYANGLRMHIDFIKPKKLDDSIVQSQEKNDVDIILKSYEYSKRFSEVGHFYEGIAIVKNNGKYNYINQEGKLLSNEWFDDITKFHNGVGRVNKYNKYNFINQDGKIMSNEWFDDITKFRNGVASVKKNNKYNFINQDGKIISNEWFDEVWGFYRPVLDYGYRGYVRYVDHHVAIVKKNNKYNFINLDGTLVSDIWYDKIDNFLHNGAIVKKGDKYSFVNMDGHLVSNMWFDEIVKTDDFAFGVIDRKHYVIDDDGQIFFAEWLGFRDIDKIKMYPNFVNIDGTIICKKTEMENYNIKKGMFGYKCTNSFDSFNTKYRPIKKYGFKYTLCFDGVNLYLYDRISNENLMLGKYSNIMYDDNFIVDKKNKKIHLIYENNFVEITDYYMEHLAEKNKITITSGVDGLVSFEEFYVKKFSEIESMVSEERKKEKKQKEQEQKTKIEIQKEKEKEEKIAQVEDLKNFENDERVRALNMLKEALMLLKKLPSSDTKIAIDDIFIHKDDHLEILPIFKDVLKFIDLSNVSFENVDVHGLNFGECNLGSSFKPKEVYQANLNGCNFDKVFFSPFTDFTGVDIRGCHFSTDDDPKTIDVFNVTFKDAIYDETTTYNGISFKEIFDKKAKASR